MNQNILPEERALLTGKKAAFLSLGCKVNSYETEVMQQLFEEAGAEVVDFSEKADIYLVNTCTVTNMADRKSRQMLHKAKKNNPDGIVVAAGCYVQASAEEVKKDYAVDVLVGNNQKNEIVHLVAAYMEGKKQEAELVDVRKNKEYEPLRLKTVTEKTRAYIKIQDGCNQFCTYCIIPFARGRIRSRKEEDVLEEVRDLVAQGYQEIVLTGIHLSSYGFEQYSEKEQFALEIPGQRVPLLELILKLDKIPGLARIRLGSLEPRIITEDFVKTLTTTKVCPHFHLSLQSGCDATLQRMNRRYTTEEYKNKCDLIRLYFEHPAITTDVIAGFPGETEEEFAETLAFVQQVAFAQMHIFKYSRRHGTKADKMPNQVPEEIKTRRSDALLEVEARLRREYVDYFVNKEEKVLLEEQITEDGVTYMTGHNERYVRFAIRTEENLANQMVTGCAVNQYVKDCMLLNEKA
ncbi:MAG: tRNA (N(6)-L-threonylcarbamoyladenosine(37)-C(2))-methylthiotransferase MtaB [Lachnospiraceae bacterium]|nr:tRNA (N(6)-L-threonylcarbamoyladenosine(37)-C(2))-methylthiotransferase MtaB [Lachnospiraceae bacterium]